MSRKATRLIDRGFIGRMRRMEELSRITVTVGVQADAGAGEDGVPIAEYAGYNEFGTERIPSRPFMRNSFDGNLAEISETIARLTGGVQDGKITPDQAGGLLGELHQGHVQATIQDGVPPPNAPETIRRKGSSKPLIDQGDLVRSIRWKLEKRAGGAGRFIKSLFRRK